MVVAPITHAPPAGDAGDSIEIPVGVCRTLGLDAGRHWLRVEELNRFAWPGFDLRPIPGAKINYEYGMLPQPLFEELKRSILARQKVMRVLRRD